MNPVLADMITRFRHAQELGVEFYADTICPTTGAWMPASHKDWSIIKHQFKLDSVKAVRGVPIYVHGAGISIHLPFVLIDFDWGGAGELDGFDAGRLWGFVQRNKMKLVCGNHQQVSEWLKEACEVDELTKDGSLYYSPRHRTKRPGPATPEAEKLRVKLITMYPGLAPAFNTEWESWEPQATFTVHGLFRVLSRLIADRLSVGPEPDLQRVFEYVEAQLKTDKHSDLANAACTCFLENLMNRVPGTIPPANLVPMLGEQSRRFCRAWDEFCGVKTEGLW